MRKKEEVLVIGEVNLDCVGELKEKKIKGSFSLGGKGYNIACNLRYFDFSVDLLTYIGKEKIRKYFLEKCKENKINLIYDYFDRSSNCCVGVYEKGDFIYEHFYQREAWRLSFFPQKKYKKIIVAVDLDDYSIKKLVETQKEAEIYLSVPSVKNSKTFSKNLNNFKLIFCNYTEAKSFIKRKENSVYKILSKLGDKFIITKDKDGVFFLKENKIINVSSKIKKENIKSLFGAGDCFMASFLFFYWENNNKQNSAEKAIKYVHKILKSYKSNIL